MQNEKCRIKKSEVRPAVAEAIAGKNQRSEIGGRIVRFFQSNLRHTSFGILRPSFCILHSTFCLSSRGGQATPKASHCGGQAMIEFTIALVAIMAVIIGTLLLNRMEWAHTRTMTTARATAGALALDLIYQSSLDAKFISDWEAGADNIHYTPDDEPDLDGTAISLVGDIIANAGLDNVSSLPTNTITRLQSSPAPLNEFYLVKGNESMAVDLSAIPAVRHLISGEPSISVESEAWLVWTGGIY